MFKRYLYWNIMNHGTALSNDLRSATRWWTHTHTCTQWATYGNQTHMVTICMSAPWGATNMHEIHNMHAEAQKASLFLSAVLYLLQDLLPLLCVNCGAVCALWPRRLCKHRWTWQTKGKHTKRPSAGFLSNPVHFKLLRNSGDWGALVRKIEEPSKVQRGN